MATLLPGGRATIRGSKEQYGPRVVSGELQCEASMTCQRCLQPVTVPLEGSIRWGLVFSESEMQSLEQGLDPILIEEDNFFHTSRLKMRWFCYCRLCRCATVV